MATKRISELPEAEDLIGDELVEVSQLSQTVLISAATISAQASDNSFNDSGSGFVSAGFAVGDRVQVAGFTGNALNNLFVGAITALTSAKMTIGGTDGDVIVDDAAGELVTITKWTSKRSSMADIAVIVAAAIYADVATVSAGSNNLLASQAGKYLRFTDASAKTLTVQPDATEPMPENGEWHIRCVGSGDLTLVEGSGVTINPPNGGTLDVPSGGTVTLKWVAVDEYDLLGQTVAA